MKRTDATGIASAEPKKYTLYGTIADLKIRGAAKKVMIFDLVRGERGAERCMERNGGTLRCVAFGKVIASIRDFGLRNGDEIKIWGYYVDGTFTGRDGIERETTEFHILKADPAPQTKAEPTPEASDAAAPSPYAENPWLAVEGSLPKGADRATIRAARDAALTCAAQARAVVANHDPEDAEAVGYAYEMQFAAQDAEEAAERYSAMLGEDAVA